MIADYQSFLSTKAKHGAVNGFSPLWIPDFLFDFQQAMAEWAIQSGRCALFEDCGMGKTPQYLVWAENVVRHTNKPVLVLTPLAVCGQVIREAEKFGIDAMRSSDGMFPPGARVVVTNYQRLDKFDPHQFAGTVCDESSILKNADGKTKAAVTEFLRVIRYRLLCTATAAPNDFVELGTSSEALGYMGFRDMATMFFTQQTAKDRLGWARTKWRLRHHAQENFWRWVCSWARAMRRPSDLGFDDGLFVLPPIETTEHVVKASVKRAGVLFDMPAMTLQEEREERRRTIGDRCGLVADLLNNDESAVAWCHLNDEGDELRRLIAGSEQVSGSDSDERKEELFDAFSSGQIRVLVTKPSIAGFGLNWQHCSQTTFFPSHSFEQWYQAIRRFYRFGQTKTVRVHVVASEGEAGVLGNLKSKEAAAEEMFSRLVALMNDSLSINSDRTFDKQETVPAWL